MHKAFHSNIALTRISAIADRPPKVPLI